MKMYSVQSNDSVNGVMQLYDKKRYWWLGGLVYSALPILFSVLYFIYPNPWLFIASLALLIIIVPIVDAIIGVKRGNPSDALVAEMEKDPYYANLLIAIIPIHFAAVIVPAWLIASQNLSVGFYVAFSLVVAFYSGFSINTAHEIGHKRSKFERFLSRLTLSVSGYGHFCVDHNAGHHKDVSTPEDPVSARMGESIYRYALREIPGAFKRGWSIEKARLVKRDLAVWSHHNHILQSYAMTLVWQGALVATLGWIVLPFLLFQNAAAWFQLTSANYIEHYGLLREKKENGRYEKCQPHHSWNSNHVFSNLLLFQLQRHSDHHANPSRSYESLRSFDSLPELPSGYLGMYLLAYIPLLWFAVMNKRLLSIAHIQGDFTKVNIDPKYEAKIRHDYGVLAAADRKRQSFARLFT